MIRQAERNFRRKWWEDGCGSGQYSEFTCNDETGWYGVQVSRLDETTIRVDARCTDMPNFASFTGTAALGSNCVEGTVLNAAACGPDIGEGGTAIVVEL